MRNSNSSARSNREMIVVTVLLLLTAAFVAGYFLLIGGQWFLGFVGVVVALALLGTLHYLIWGWSLPRRRTQQPLPVRRPSELPRDRRRL